MRRKRSSAYLDLYQRLESQIQSSLHRQQEGLFERLCHPAQEAGCVSAVDQAMIVGERKRQYQSRLKFSINPNRFGAGAREAEDRDLRMVHDRRKSRAPDPTQVRNGEG